MPISYSNIIRYMVMVCGNKMIVDCICEKYLENRPMKNQALDDFRDLSGDKSRQQTAHTVPKKNYIARVLVLTHDFLQTLQSILHVRLRGVCQ